MPTAPRIRTQGGIPTVPDTVEFLDRVQAVHNVFPGIPGLPGVPLDIPLYRWDGGKPVPRTEDELAADRAAIPAPPPSEQERLRADVDFLAALQGVAL